MKTRQTTLDSGDVLRAQGVVRSKGRFTLGPVNLTLHEGEIMAVVGASGCGKSSLLRAMAGMVKLDRGSVVFEDRRLDKLGEAALASLRSSQFAFIFQDYMLLENLSIAENVALPAAVRGERMEMDRIRRSVACVGLQEKALDTPVTNLSGGQQQRVAIARALAIGAQVLFADEPTGNLDPKSRDDVVSTIRTSMNAGLRSVLIVAHDPVVAAAADRIVFMQDGRIVREFPQGLQTRQVEELLLGRAPARPQTFGGARPVMSR
ncbi:ABC transporter ATP-binding protein [Bifidobacterium bombi]|uniref:ABC transporter, ATP-binding protein n=1 Tax=Bifidobacterium bombi DSM 19703 TaxID=1341695 RepID=A0A080N453_9BIFI|nr:ABC transporter ATP-binding protein [Bifidobacterium bombi]KFF31045.1 ABC transporter, ATP-binding protein [Bifidobacterium bombi DSM 19703]